MRLRRKLFTMRVVRHWYRMLRDVVNASTPKTFKGRLD